MVTPLRPTGWELTDDGMIVGNFQEACPDDHENPAAFVPERTFRVVLKAVSAKASRIRGKPVVLIPPTPSAPL
ncbi:hypothetical protein RHODO2019_10940 [Rhodococcus antarcticus]|uniref:Uncharacterized protein n=1 Tax=Rhodococcus antarcticus TaxID=2987751 RepID=A0ABY6NXR5_9NOCA|nr:hypothetical protein [Rhodococcus antarcticus]UZJ23723.1 hypothetical protein RHODO2019_10940 [Rhodococcus antarcticus]